jgi:hypothetical protein
MKIKVLNCGCPDDNKGEHENNCPEFQPDWTQDCDMCGEMPVVPITGMCGPCTFGEADTAGGNW